MESFIVLKSSILPSKKVRYISSFTSYLYAVYSNGIVKSKSLSLNYKCSFLVKTLFKSFCLNVISHRS